MGSASPRSIPRGPKEVPLEPELTILMPCLNEAETLPTCIRKARGWLHENEVEGEILIADNGSTDGSVEIAEDLGARVVHVEERGYGATLYRGSLEARGTYVIMGDADDSYDWSKLEGFVTKLREGYDLVMGNRFAGGIEKGAMPWANRYFGNPLLSFLGRRLHRSRVGDFYCGLRGFARKSFPKLDLRTTGMEYAAEMVIKAQIHGLRIAEVPTKLHPDGRSRRPHLRPWRDGWRGLRFLLLYSPRWLFLYPGLFLMLAGGLVCLWLLPGPRSVGAVTFDAHTLLYGAVAVLVGFQAVVFAVFAKVFAIQEDLLPRDRRLDALFRVLTLERGLALGAVLLALGLGLGIYGVAKWAGTSFADLEFSRMLRVVIPSGLLIALGSQVILSSFLLSILGLAIRRPGAR